MLENRDGIEMRSIDVANDEDEPDPGVPLIGEREGSPGNGKSKGAQPAGQWFVWSLAASAGLGGLLFGYDTGVISSTLVSLHSDLSNRPLGTFDKGLITSCTSLSAFVAAPAAGLLADRYGRKRTILIADFLFMIGAMWQAVTTSVMGMIVGRSIVGLGIGAASLVAPLYISELAPSHIRGRLVTTQSLLITGGQVVAYVVGWLFSQSPGGWRWMVGLGGFPALIQFVLLVPLPDTPRFLVMSKQEARAYGVLCKIHESQCSGMSSQTSSTASHVLSQIEEEIKESSVHSGHTSKAYALISITSHRRALTISCMLQALQQLSGFNSLMYFSATIFASLDFSSPTLTSLSVAVTNFLFTIAAFSLIDRIGRRRILLITIPIMILALLLCAISFSFIPFSEGRTSAEHDRNDTSVLAFLILGALLLYTAPFAAGLGCVPWQQSELFPLSVRSVGCGIATGCNWISNFAASLTFLPLIEYLGANWTFGLYALICLLGWLGIWAIYPEMSGLSLEEVVKVLEDGWGTERSPSGMSALLPES